MSNSGIGFGDKVVASVTRRQSEADVLRLAGRFKVVCKDKHGNVKWEDEGENIIVDTGVDYILGTGVLDSATLYIGLLGSSPSPVAGWTMTQAAAAEAAGYDEAGRQAWGQGSVSAKTVTNASPASFTMDGTDTIIGGAFITTDQVKDGTAGTLIAAKAFTGGNKTVGDGDTLNVTYTVSGSST